MHNCKLLQQLTGPDDVIEEHVFDRKNCIFNDVTSGAVAGREIADLVMRQAQDFFKSY